MKIIAVIDENGALGNKGELLCHLSEDLRRFQKLTYGKSVVMGMRTLASLPGGMPLKGRTNVVVTRIKNMSIKNCHVVNKLKDLDGLLGEAFIIGGGQLYEAMIDRVDTMYITIIHHKFREADTFFPSIDPGKWKIIDKERNYADIWNDFSSTFVTYIRR